MRVLHQAAEIPVTPQQEIFDDDGRFIARADLRIDGTGGSTSTTVRGIGRLMSTKSTWNATGPSSASVGSGTATPRNTGRRDGAAIIADAAPPARTGLESASAGCVAGPARPFAPRTGWPRPGVLQLAASHCRNRSDATRRRPKSGWYVTGYVRGRTGSGALLATLTLGELVARHQSRQHRVPDDLRCDDHLGDVIAARNVVHDVQQYLFEDRPQPASARAA